MNLAIIRAFFDGYARAFTAQDAAAICDHYVFPVQVLSEETGYTFRDRAEMLADMTGFVAFYDKVNFGQARIAAFDFQPLSAAFGQVHLTWELIDKDGARIIAFETTYVLRLAGGGVAPGRAMIAGILAHSEDSAWRARDVAIGW